jgi:hypothetical protein
MRRRARLFAGSELAGQRAAAVMSLVQSAKLHGRDPWAPAHASEQRRIEVNCCPITGILGADRTNARSASTAVKGGWDDNWTLPLQSQAGRAYHCEKAVSLRKCMCCGVPPP